MSAPKLEYMDDPCAGPRSQTLCLIPLTAPSQFFSVNRLRGMAVAAELSGACHKAFALGGRRIARFNYCATAGACFCAPGHPINHH